MKKCDFSLDIFMHTDIITFNFLSKNQIISEDFAHLLHEHYICDSFLLIQAVSYMNLDPLHLTNKENTLNCININILFSFLLEKMLTISLSLSLKNESQEFTLTTGARGSAMTSCNEI